MLALKHSLNVESKQIIYVDQNATGSGTGKSWANACTTIQAGLDLASDGTGWIVKIAPGTYYLQTALYPWPNTTVSGSGRNLTIIDGRSSVRGFECYTHRASNCNFEHMTIQNCSGSIQVVSGAYASRNAAAIFGFGNGYWGGDNGYGGQINSSNAGSRTGGYVYDVRFYKTKTTTSNNFSVCGCINSFKWAINCIFDDVYNFNHPVQAQYLFGCIFMNGRVPHNCYNCSVGAKNNTPDANDGMVVNCSFFKDTVNETCISNGVGFLINCLLFNNGTSKFDNNNSKVPVSNCIIDSNMTYYSSSNPKPTIVSNVGTVSSTDCHLVAGSPCIGAGTTNFYGLFDNCPVDYLTDLDGNKRIRNGQIDVGAYAYIG